MRAVTDMVLLFPEVLHINSVKLKSMKSVLSKMEDDIEVLWYF